MLVGVPTSLVEIHVPLPPREGVPDGEPPQWADVVEEFLADAEDRGELEVYDEGEDLGDAYVFLVSGAPTNVLLRFAGEVAKLPGVPSGAVAYVSDDDAETFGLGRRVELRR